MLSNVPVIDISPSRTGDEAAAVGRAVNDIGFLVIIGHGIDPALIAATRSVSAFFDRPLAEKRRVLRPAPDVTRGDIPLEGESIDRGMGIDLPGDLNESFMIGAVDPYDPAYMTAPEAGTHFHRNLWPEKPSEPRPPHEAYFRAMGDLATRLMALFALALDLPERFFDDKIDRHISRLRIGNHPTPATPPLPHQLRAGAHADYGSLTILRAADKPGGLQVLNCLGAWV